MRVGRQTHKVVRGPDGGDITVALTPEQAEVAVRHGRRRRRLDGSAPRWWGPGSVVVPAYNENASITATVMMLMF